MKWAKDSVLSFQSDTTGKIISFDRPGMNVPDIPGGTSVSPLGKKRQWSLRLNRQRSANPSVAGERRFGIKVLGKWKQWAGLGLATKRLECFLMSAETLKATHLPPKPITKHGSAVPPSDGVQPCLKKTFRRYRQDMWGKAKTPRRRRYVGCVELGRSRYAHCLFFW